MTVGDILDGAFRLLRERFGRIALLVLVVLGPYQLLVSFLTAGWLPDAFGPGGPQDPAAPFEDIDVGSFIGAFTLTGILGFVVHVLVAGALVWIVLREDRGETLGLGESLRGGLERAWPLLGGTLLVALIGTAIGLGAVLLTVALGAVALPLAVLFALPVFPVLMATFAAATSLVVPVAMVERHLGAAACGVRALSLLRRRFGRILGVTVLILLVVLLVTMAISLLLGVGALLAGPLAWVVDGISGTAVSIVTTPVTAFAALLLYVDARVRLEGWDLQLRTQDAPPW